MISVDPDRPDAARVEQPERGVEDPLPRRGARGGGPRGVVMPSQTDLSV